MSSKSDRDNHSNQLNRNNAAYSSSRGWTKGRDDDGADYEDGCAPVRRLSPEEERWQEQVREANRRMANTDPVERDFHFDFVTLDGRIYAHRVTIRISNPHLSRYSAQEVLEECFNRIWQALRLAAKAPLAFGRASTDEGEWLEDLGFEYRPGATRATDSGRTQISEYDRLWFEKAMTMAGDAKRRILERIDTQRVFIGVVDEQMMAERR